MTGLAKVFDAAYPPATVPPGCAGVLGYIGGSAAEHEWTLEEWQRFAHLVQFPCWVPDITRSAVSQAADAVLCAWGLGWRAHDPSGWERAIVFDLETASNAAWWLQCESEVSDYGFVAVAYGSMSTVLQNAAASVWAADWDDEVVLQAGQTVHGTQYEADVSFDYTRIDYSVADEWLMARGGVGPRHLR